MKKKETLIIFVLAVLIGATISHLFEPQWYGGPVTFPTKQFHHFLWRAGLPTGTVFGLTVILTDTFWFMVLLVGYEIGKQILRKQRIRRK